MATLIGMVNLWLDCRKNKNRKNLAKQPSPPKISNLFALNYSGQHNRNFAQKASGKYVGLGEISHTVEG